MRLSLADAIAKSAPKRWLLFGAVVLLGVAAGRVVDVEPSDRLYGGLLQLFGNPSAQIPSLAAGVGLGFVLGFIHLTSI